MTINTKDWDGVVDPYSTLYHSFYWPLAPGDWWAPNFGPSGSHIPFERNDYAPGDTVLVIVSPQTRILKTKLNRKGVSIPSNELAGPPYSFRISVWGADDTYMEMEPSVYFTAREAQDFLRSLPNPLSREWLRSQGFGNY